VGYYQKLQVTQHTLLESFSKSLRAEVEAQNVGNGNGGRGKTKYLGYVARALYQFKNVLKRCDFALEISENDYDSYTLSERKRENKKVTIWQAKIETLEM
jgi:hypothetical protein